jgi:hypothetical protein
MSGDWLGKNLVVQSHQQHPEVGFGVTDSDGLVTLGYTKPSATPDGVNT